MILLTLIPFSKIDVILNSVTRPTTVSQIYSFPDTYFSQGLSRKKEITSPEEMQYKELTTHAMERLRVKQGML